MNVPTTDYALRHQLQARQLERAATALLRRKGFNRDGKSNREVNPSQEAFEALLIKTPTGGKPGRRL